MKERMKCDLNEYANNVLDLPSLETIGFSGDAFKFCHLAIFESML